MSNAKETSDSEKPAGTLKALFEQTPPDKLTHIPAELKYPKVGMHYWALDLPEIKLHCSKCENELLFEPDVKELNFSSSTVLHKFIIYSCKNCESYRKLYCVRAVLRSNVQPQMVDVIKIGESPAYGPPTPAKLLRLLGSKDKDYFLKGRRCEIQGLGIGAFTYYRRIIEDKRNVIFDEIIRVSKNLGADAASIAELEAAKKQTRFSDAVDSIKHGIPQALMIQGANPLTLLHSALSEGLHAGTDEECLELATDIRLVLTEFIEKVSHAMKDDAQLNAAVTNLLNRNVTKAKKALSEAKKA